MTHIILATSYRYQGQWH